MRMRTSDALDLERGVFTGGNPRPFRSAMSMLNFEINRAAAKPSERKRRKEQGVTRVGENRGPSPISSQKNCDPDPGFRRYLPRGVAARVRDAGAAARRFRPRRGGAARGVPCGAGAMAARWRAAEPARLARVGGPLQGDRRDPPGVEVRCAGRRQDRDARGGAPAGKGGDRGRPPAPHLHLLPSGARARRAGGAHAARGLRAQDRGDRARLPHARADDRAAHRARQEQDPRRAHSVRGARAARARRAAGGGAARAVPGLQRRLFRRLPATR